VFKRIKLYLSDYNILKTLYCLFAFNILFSISIFSYSYYEQSVLKKRLCQNIGLIVFDKLEYVLYENEKILKYVGKYIKKNNLQNNQRKMKDFLEEIESINFSVFLTSYVSWSDANGFITVTGKGSIVPKKDRRSIHNRTYFKKCKDTPNKLFTSHIERSLFTDKNVLPTALGVSTEKNEFLGYLVLGINYNELIRHLKNSIRENYDIIIYFDNNEVIINTDSSIQPKKTKYTDINKKNVYKTDLTNTKNNLGIEVYIVDNEIFLLSPVLWVLFILASSTLLLLFIFQYVRYIVIPLNSISTFLNEYRCGKQSDFNIYDKIERGEVQKIAIAIKNYIDVSCEKFEKMKGIIKQGEAFSVSLQEREKYYKELIRRVQPAVKKFIMGDNFTDNTPAFYSRTEEDINDISRDMFFDTNAAIKSALLFYYDETEKAAISISKRFSKDIPLIEKDYIEFKNLFLCIVNFVIHNTMPGGSLKAITTYCEEKNIVFVRIEYAGCLEKEDFFEYNKKNDDPVDNFYNCPEKLIKKAKKIGCVCTHEKIKNIKGCVFNLEIQLTTNIKLKSNVIGFSRTT